MTNPIKLISKVKKFISKVNNTFFDFFRSKDKHSENALSITSTPNEIKDIHVKSNKGDIIINIVSGNENIISNPNKESEKKNVKKEK